MANLFPLQRSCKARRSSRLRNGAHPATYQASCKAMRSSGSWCVPLALALTLGLCSTAHAEGDIQLRLYSVPPPLGIEDSVSVSMHYQTPAGEGPATTLDLSAERRLVTFGVRYSRPHHTFQASGQSSADLEAGRTNLTTTVVYTYVPDAPAEGVALTSTTLLYVLSGNQTPTYGVYSNTAGLSVGVRLNSHVNTTTTATVTAVKLTSQDDLIWSGNVSSSLVYAQEETFAYLAPGVSIQNGQALWNLSGGGSTKLSPDLTVTGAAFWSVRATPSANAALSYATGPWQLSTTVAYSGQDFSVGVGAHVALLNDFNVGASVALVPSILMPIYAAEISKQAGGLRFGVGATLTAPPNADPTFTTQASVSGQRKPWQGSLNVSYTQSPTSATGSANGTLGYTEGRFGAQLSLGLNLGRVTGGVTALTGIADLTLNYAVTSRLDLSGSARYERSVAAEARPDYRFGLGVRYHFDEKEF